MKKAVLALSLSLLLLSSAGSASDLLPDESRKLSSEYLQYDSNRVYSDGVINWSYDYTFVLTQKQNKVFPAPAEIREEKKPFTITIRMSQPENQLKPEECKKSEKQERKPEEETETVKVKKELITVYFPFNRAYLTADQREKLLSTIRKLKSKYGSNSTITAEVIGSACPVGSERYNKTLSLRRAKTVARLLEKEGIKVVEVKGIGKIRESGVLCLNRRAVVTFEVKLEKTDESSENIPEKRKPLLGINPETNPQFKILKPDNRGSVSEGERNFCGINIETGTKPQPGNLNK